MIRVFLPSLLFSSLLAVQGCISEADFNAKYSETLKGNTLPDLFLHGGFLGQGGFGRVVEISWTKEPIAVKRIKQLQDEIHIILLENELYFLRKLSEKQIVPELIECVEIGEFIYILQEMVFRDLNMSLMQYAYKTKNVEQRLKFFRKILVKFSDLHKASIIHEDAKPENIMSTDKFISDVRIIDLGLSTKIGSKVAGGTDLYSGKEKIPKMPKEGDPRHDIYALGLTFAVMEANKLKIFVNIKKSCFQTEMTEDCHEKLMANIMRSLIISGMGPMLEVIQHACAYDLDKRYPTVDRMIEDFDYVLNSLPPETKDLVIVNNPKELLAAKEAVLAETNKEKQFELDKKIIENDKFVKENKNLLETKVKMPEAVVLQTNETKDQQQLTENLQVSPQNSEKQFSKPDKPISYFIDKNIDFTANGFKYTFIPEKRAYRKTKLDSNEVDQFPDTVFHQGVVRQKTLVSEESEKSIKKILI